MTQAAIPTLMRKVFNRPATNFNSTDSFDIMMEKYDELFLKEKELAERRLHTLAATKHIHD